MAMAVKNELQSVINSVLQTVYIHLNFTLESKQFEVILRIDKMIRMGESSVK